MSDYQACVVSKYFGKMIEKNEFKTLLTNLDDYELFEYKKIEYKGLFQKLEFFTNIHYYRTCFNRDTMEIELLMEQLKQELITVQNSLMELSYQIQVLSYQQPVFTKYEIADTDTNSIVDTNSIASTILDSEAESIASTVICSPKMESVPMEFVLNVM